MPEKKKSGGKRENAGRKPGKPYSTHQFNVDTKLLNELKQIYGTKLLNEKLRGYMEYLNRV